MTLHDRVECSLVREPRQHSYRALLDALLPFSTTVILVSREQLTFSEEAHELLRRLLPFRIRRVRTSKWPGTELSGHLANIDHYSATREVVAILKGAVDGLYEWTCPSRPEDLCLLDDDGEPVLGTIAHEKDAWIPLPADALESVRTVVGHAFFGESA